MTLSTLQISQIQQFHDGEISEGSVSELLTSSSHARVYLTALQELSGATKAAMEEAWEKADATNAVADWSEAAFGATRLLDMKIQELAPMLERFHDDEVSPMESASVLALMQERDDIVAYLENLDMLSGSVKGVDFSEGVNFDGFFDKVAAELKLETKAPSNVVRLDHAFSYEEHAVLLQRFFDEEVTPREQQRVQSWIDSENEDVIGALEACEELSLATTIASEQAVEQADFSNLWASIESEISQTEEKSTQSEQVVQIGAFREKKAEASFFQKYQQSIFTAVAAVLLLGVFGPQMFGSEKHTVEKIVIIDGISSEPGTSVRIDAPMRPVSAQVEEDDEEESTVIWITDESLDTEDVKDKEPLKDNELKASEEPI